MVLLVKYALSFLAVNNFLQILLLLRNYNCKQFLEQNYCLMFTINSQSKLKTIQHTSFDILTTKNTVRILTRFHGGRFELKTLQILITASLLKTVI